MIANEIVDLLSNYKIKNLFLLFAMDFYTYSKPKGLYSLNLNHQQCFFSFLFLFFFKKTFPSSFFFFKKKQINIIIIKLAYNLPHLEENFPINDNFVCQLLNLLFIENIPTTCLIYPGKKSTNSLEGFDKTVKFYFSFLFLL